MDETTLEKKQLEITNWYRSKYGHLPPALVLLNLMSNIGDMSYLTMKIINQFKLNEKEKDLTTRTLCEIMTNYIQLCTLYDIKVEDILNKIPLNEDEEENRNENNQNVFDNFQQG
jgi:hypothetical protein